MDIASMSLDGVHGSILVVSSGWGRGVMKEESSSVPLPKCEFRSFGKCWWAPTTFVFSSQLTEKGCRNKRLLLSVAEAELHFPFLRWLLGLKVRPPRVLPCLGRSCFSPSAIPFFNKNLFGSIFVPGTV